MAAAKEYRTHRPSGQVAPPLILLEGAEKAGKSYTAALFSGSDRIGATYWIEFGEVTAEEYGAVPGADYEIVEHDGSFADLHGAIQWVYGKAAAAKAAGEKPVMLVIDSMTAEWELLKGWAANRAKGSKSNRAKLAADPNAEITISGNLWNDANDRHALIMKLFRTFPGIVVMIAQGKVVSAIGDNGQPIEGKKDYRVEGQKQIGFQSSCWVRLSRDEPALLVGCRKVVGGIKPGVDPAKQLPPNWTLEWLVFEFLQYDHAKAAANNLVEPKPERTPEQIADEALLPATSVERLAELWNEARQSQYGSVIVPNERGQDELLPDLLRRVGQERRAAGPAMQEQHARMHALWNQTEVGDDRDARLKWTSEIVGRPIETSSDLTMAEAEQVARHLDAYIKKNTPPAETREAA